MAVTSPERLTERLQKIRGSIGDGTATSDEIGGFGSPGDVQNPMGKTPALGRGFGRSGGQQSSNAADVAAEIMSQDSKLMQSAEAKGLQFGNRRGLMNSSISAGAATDAALEYVVPLAQQEAGQRFESDMSDKTFVQDLKLQERDAENQMDLAQLDADTRLELFDREAEMRAMLQEAEIAADSRNQMASMVTDLQEQYQRSVQSILSNPDLPADERNSLLKAAGELLQPQMEMTKSIYGMEFNWLDTAFNASSYQATPAPTSQETSSPTQYRSEPRTSEDRG